MRAVMLTVVVECLNPTITCVTQHAKLKWKSVTAGAMKPTARGFHRYSSHEIGAI